jgi:HAD superfamily hydrolase (TIGR01509 family)
VSRSERPELVIFDCDGVLVDSERLSIDMEVEILAELGWQITREEIVERFLGISDEDYLALVEKEIGRPLPEGWHEEITARFRETFERQLRAIPGIATTLSVLEDAGIKTCVASSGSHEKIRHSLGLTGLLPHFEGRIFSAVDVERGKPAPDLFLHAASSLGVEPARSLVVEDSPYGLEGALAARMRAVAYAGGLVPLRRLEREGVTVISDMAELPQLILGPGAEEAQKRAV